LKEELMHRPVLVLAPGQSVHEHADELQKFIDDKSARVICVNYMDKRLPVHYVFSSNFRRYKDLEFAENVKKIITSNVKDAHIYDYLVNFSSYVTGDPEIVDNSGLMLLHLLSAIGLSKVYVAGMDGYSVDNSKNYINSGLEYNFGENRINQRNKLITEELRKINKILSLVFLTETCYHYQQGV
jgi:4-hydroxy 2-oxovalerate aldolase